VFEIRKRIDSNFPRVRAAALLALGALGEHAKDHVDAVAEKINDPHAVVKEASPIF
jgi:HEAT repeat protein